MAARVVVLAASLSMLMAGCNRAPEAMLPARPGAAHGMDVLLVTLDTTRADHLGCYGRRPSNTPTLDRLCAEGTRFDNAVTSAPVTLPAHASIMTGLLPNHHGARYNGEFELDGAHAVLAEELKSAGYQTAAFVSSFVLERRFGLGRGFDVYDDHVESVINRRGILSHNERDADSVTRAALAYLHQREAGKPVFLWVHYYDAHAPYAPLNQPEKPGNEAAYSAEIGDVDAALGRLLASADLDLARTVVIVTADHGESLGEHDERTHGLFLYESTTHVPLIVRLPGTLLGGRHEAGLAAHVDIRPSLLSLLGVPAAAPADGVDWLSRRREPNEGVYQEASLPYLDFGFAPVYGWREAHEHFIGGTLPERYDLITDPGEQTNLAESGDRSRIGAMQQRLDAAMLDAPDIVEAAAQAKDADPETLARLRSLGYVGGAAPAPGADLPDPRSKIQTINLHQDAAADLDAGKAAQALQRLELADTLSPRNLSILRLMAKAELRLGRIDSAEKTLMELISLKKNADSLVLLAQIRILREDYVPAATLLDEAEQLDPHSGGVWIARGDIAQRQGNSGMAETAYRRAIEIDSDRIREIAQGRIQALDKKRDGSTQQALK